MELFSNLLDGVVAVAELNDLEARPLQAQRLFRCEKHAGELRFFVQAHAGREAGSVCQFRLQAFSSTSPIAGTES